MKTRGVLPCNLDRDREIAYAFWYKGVTFTGRLIIYNYRDGVWEKLGPGYESGSYNITENFSLIINSVSLEDNDQFTCEIVYLGAQNAQKSMNVSVFSKFALAWDILLQHEREMYCYRFRTNSNDIHVVNIIKYFPFLDGMPQLCIHPMILRIVMIMITLPCIHIKYSLSSILHISPLLCVSPTLYFVCIHHVLI